MVAVIDDEGIGGIITRGRIFERMSGQFGLPLNGGRPASELCVAATTVQASIVAAAASHIALTRPPSAQSDPLIVLDGKTYAGVVGMHELLQQLLTEEVAEARLMSPLTGLPGNRLIRRQIEAVHSAEQSLLLLYADIDNFKSFNDRFGFAHGDAAISGLATALLEAADVCTCEPFVGHVGGDDFVLLVDERDLPAFRAALQVRLARRWFDPDRRLALDRLTVSIGGGPLAELHDRAYEDLGLVVAAAKRSLKEAGGDCFVVYPSLATFETVLERVA
ncbi:MAG: diguanylate cyclase [Dehalococcoidia bacterium]|uniref:GGDEF domain-containing protein n=1 Tax=Candidatus Amarobacter glycogenicus TaxID=3140699 RepID=UPI003134E663|nr:diguanylate cyclase [Dehalococcoidia bacterium]